MKRPRSGYARSRSAVASSVISPDSHLPFSAAPIALTFASPIDTPIDEPSRRAVQPDARDAVVGKALDQLALGVERPADDLADRAGLVQAVQLLARR